jgi:hypothetical protein
MKKLVILTAFIFLSANILAQEKQTEIYNYVNGVREISPTYIIEDNTKIFELTNGVKNISPSLIIKENKVYEVTSGVQQLYPKLEVRADVPNVYSYDSVGSLFSEINN